MDGCANRFKRKKTRLPWGTSAGLREKISAMGGQTGLALEIDPTNAPALASRELDTRSAGIFGCRAEPLASSMERTRLFHSTASSSPSHHERSKNHCSSSATPARSVGASTVSRRSRFSRASANHTTRITTTAVHVVCAISENLARETCVSSLDAGSPTTIQVRTARLDPRLVSQLHRFLQHFSHFQ